MIHITPGMAALTPLSTYLQAALPAIPGQPPPNPSQNTRNAISSPARLLAARRERGFMDQCSSNPSGRCSNMNAWTSIRIFLAR
ncbi:hypothetical protein BJX99DRAFT_19707 [Aspergillus californicus]